MGDLDKLLASLAAGRSARGARTLQAAWRRGQ